MSNDQGIFLSRGKTDDEIAATRVDKEQKNNRPHCKITLTQKEYSDFEVATANVEYLLQNAANIFQELEGSLAVGSMDVDSSGFITILEMVGRGFKNAALDEGEKITLLSSKIRSEKELINDH